MQGLLGDYTFQLVAFGTGLLGALCGLLGTFAVLRRQSLIGDVVAHAALPGVVAAFLLTGLRTTEVLLIGGFCTSLLAALLVGALRRGGFAKFDSAMALVMSSLLGLGLVLLTYAQKLPRANQAGLKNFIYGQASTLLARDVWLLVGCCLVLGLLTLLFWKEFSLLAFDPLYATSLGLPVKGLGGLLTLMTVAALVVGLQMVGVVLVSALLIAPPAAARQWTNRLGVMATLAALFGAVSGLMGTFLSSALKGVPTGPAICLCASAFALVSLTLAPRRGLVASALRRRRQVLELKEGVKP